MGSRQQNKKNKNTKEDINSRFLKDLELKMKTKKKGINPNLKRKPNSNNKNNGKFSFIFVIAIIALTFFLVSGPDKQGKFQKTSYSEFYQGVKDGKIKSCLIINQSTIQFETDGIAMETKIPYEDTELVGFLLANSVHIESKEVKDSIFKQMFPSFIFWIFLLLVFYLLFFRQIRGKAGSAFTFGKSKAKLINQADISHTFNDVQGCEEAKEDLVEIVGFLKNPKKYINMGAKIPKGVLLVGPPGTGKTMLAKAVAGEAKVPFFSMSGSDFVEMFVGVGASRVRDLFETGKKHSPCILFIDEIDAVGRMRGAGYGGGHDEREQTLNQLLVEMDGFDTSDTVIVMAATNRSDVLDRALLRPGRFDRQVIVDLPDVKGRKGILRVYAKKVKLSKNIDLDTIARGTPGFTGADLANLINESALLAARAGEKEIKHEHLEEARDKVMMGAERKSMLIDNKEKRMTAYHEAGHALVGMLLKSANRLHKVSIVPRGRALGLTWFLPEDGVHSASKTKLKQELMVKFGGRVAEEIIFKEISTGAANDIETATKLARSMVCQYGMSRLGPISFGEKDKPIFIGGEVGQKEDYSEDTAKKIDNEVARLLTEAYNNTVQLLQKNISKLKKFSEALLEKEVMDVDEIYKLLNMKIPKTDNV